MKKRLSHLFIFKFIKNTAFFIIILGFLAYISYVALSSLKTADKDIALSGIEVTVNSSSYVYINNIKIGTASPSDSFLYTKISPGGKRVKLVKIEDEAVFYERDVIFEKGTKVIIDWNFGVTSETSSGIVKYFVQKSEQKNKIRIVSSNKSANISIDGTLSSDNTIIADGMEHKVEIQKDGYLTRTLKLSLASNLINTSTNNANSEKYADYDLVVEVTLFEIPFN